MLLSLEAVGPLKGQVKVPGDKSISHRVAILGALARGTLQAANFAPGADVRSTLKCVESLGARVSLDGSDLSVQGTGGALVEPDDILDCGNSGTTMRLLTGVLAAQSFTSILTGDSSLRRRPMDRIIDPLTAMGARIGGRDGNRAPLVVNGSALRGIRYESRVASAQVKSAVLLAGLLSGDDTAVSEPARSRDHTERMMRSFGAEVVNLGNEVFLEGGDPGRLCAPPEVFKIPGDPSSAAFLVAAALLVPGSEVRLTDVGLNPTRIGFLMILERAGARIGRENIRQWAGEPVGDLHITAGPLRGFVVTEDEIPSLIDEIPMLALVAANAYGSSVFRGAGELRVKETDRLGALVDELGHLGAELEVLGDDLVVRGGRDLRSGDVDSRGDHRMAMTLALAGLGDVEVRVAGGRAIDVSYPGFAGDLQSLGVGVTRPRSRGLAGILGYPARHSLSPKMFRAAFSAAGLDWDYRIFEVAPEDLPAATESVRVLDLAGVNVTVPYKRSIIELLDELDPTAAGIGAVNVVVNRDGKLVGYNTDGFGALRALREGGCAPEGLSVLLLGAGGAARAAAFALARVGICSLHVANRTPQHAEDLAADVLREHPGLCVSSSNLDAAPGEVDLVVQATSVGMGDGRDSPLPEGYTFRPGATLLEMVYAPAETALVRRARAQDIRVIPGLEMLIYQGMRGFELMTGFPPPADVMGAALKEGSACYGT